MSALFHLTRCLPVLLVWLLSACHGDAQTPATPSAPPLQQAANRYRVKPNDTLYAIGVAHHVSYQTLAKLNLIEPPYTLTIGQEIKLPDTPSRPENLTSANLQTVTYSNNLGESAAYLKKNTLDIAESATENETELTLYTVKKDETLYSISTRFGFTPAYLSALNGIEKPEQLREGQILKISKSKQKHSLSKTVENLTKTPENSQLLSHKTSIISNNNESMLKLYHQLPVKGEILKNFAQTGNRGIEIGGKLGQTVRAVAKGKVVAIKPAIYGYGVFVVLEHADGYLTSYANNRRVLVKTGQQVREGQAIALMGQIGLNRPSVEFEVRKNGQLCDPSWCLPK